MAVKKVESLKISQFIARSNLLKVIVWIMHHVQLKCSSIISRGNPDFMKLPATLSVQCKIPVQRDVNFAKVV